MPGTSSYAALHRTWRIGLLHSTAHHLLHIRGLTPHSDNQQLLALLLPLLLLLLLLTGVGLKADGRTSCNRAVGHKLIIHIAGHLFESAKRIAGHLFDLMGRQGCVLLPKPLSSANHAPSLILLCARPILDTVKSWILGVLYMKHHVHTWRRSPHAAMDGVTPS